MYVDIVLMATKQKWNYEMLDKRLPNEVHWFSNFSALHQTSKGNILTSKLSITLTVKVYEFIDFVKENNLISWYIIFYILIITLVSWYMWKAKLPYWHTHAYKLKA